MSLKSWVAWPGAPFGIASAMLFGASTPLAKALLGEGINPWLLAGLLYLGPGLGLAIVWVLRFGSNTEARLARRDWPWMALVVLAGGVAGPLLLMIGLSTTAASSAALLLNLEGLATMAIAWAVFHENVDRRLLVGALAILAGAVLLSWQGTGGGFGLGALAIAGACAAWGIDNNLTRKLSGSDPVQIAMVKGLAAGGVNLALAFTIGSQWPSLPLVLGAALVGFFGYGVSLVLFVLALRHLGTARTGAYFSVAPFFGAVLALLMGESLTLQLAAAGALMAIGIWLHLTEHHAHEHTHETLFHAHAHLHTDDHHQHPHDFPWDGQEPHDHPHRHAPVTHTHPHYPDAHHRHHH